MIPKHGIFTRQELISFSSGETMYSKFGVMWRLVYLLNRKVLGGNPHKVLVGVNYQLRIPRFMKQKGVVYK